MNRVAEIRRTRISGTMDNHERRVGDDWVVSVQGSDYAMTIAADPAGSTVTLEDGRALRVTSDWTPGQALARVMVDGTPVVMKVGKIPMGFRIRVRGADLKVRVQSPRQAELAALMPEKAAADTGKVLLCPMPGLVKALLVSVGQEVKAGEPLAMVEAMKMENVLRAEKDVTIAKILAKEGDSLAVDAVIMEFA